MATLFSLVNRLASRLRIGHQDMDTGLDCYDPETRVFPKIAAKAKAGRPLCKREVLLILKWKTSRLREDYSIAVGDKQMQIINQAIGEGRNDALAALTMLQGIPGIKLAVASAILSVCYPKKFTIIDENVLGVLSLFPSSLPAHKRNRYTTEYWTAAEYLDEFLPKVEQFSRRWHCGLRQADQALWGLSVEQDIQRIIANS